MNNILKEENRIMKLMKNKGNEKLFQQATECHICRNKLSEKSPMLKSEYHVK